MYININLFCYYCVTIEFWVNIGFLRAYECICTSMPSGYIMFVRSSSVILLIINQNIPTFIRWFCQHSIYNFRICWCTQNSTHGNLLRKTLTRPSSVESCIFIVPWHVFLVFSLWQLHTKLYFLITLIYSELLEFFWIIYIPAKAIFNEVNQPDSCISDQLVIDHSWCIWPWVGKTSWEYFLPCNICSDLYKCYNNHSSKYAYSTMVSRVFLGLIIIQFPEDFQFLFHCSCWGYHVAAIWASKDFNYWSWYQDLANHIRTNLSCQCLI